MILVSVSCLLHHSTEHGGVNQENDVSARTYNGPSSFVLRHDAMPMTSSAGRSRIEDIVVLQG